VVSAGTDAHHGLKPWTEGSLWDLIRKSGCGDGVALFAKQAMELIFSDVGFDLWNFRDLVPSRRRVIPVKFITAAFAVLRLNGNNLVHLFLREKLSGMPIVSGLSTRISATGFFLGSWRSIWWIFRWRGGRVPGAEATSRFEFSNFIFESLKFFFKFNNSLLQLPIFFLKVSDPSVAFSATGTTLGLTPKINESPSLHV
jgi:hypothetical protein